MIRELLNRIGARAPNLRKLELVAWRDLTGLSTLFFSRGLTHVTLITVCVPSWSVISDFVRNQPMLRELRLK